MRITSVELHPDGSDQVCVLSFRDPRGTRPYNVKSISGLDAIDGLIPKFYGNSANSVARFNALLLQKREIGLDISLAPLFADGSYSDLRDALYKMIASSRTGMVQIQFKDGDDVVAVTSGFVTKFEAPLFDKTPEVKITLSPIDPMLKALNPVNVDISGLDPADMLINDALSTAPHGFSFVVNITSPTADLIISDPRTASWSFTLTPAGGFLTGDALHFSSELNDKHISIVRGGVDVFWVADVISPGSVWPIIFPGENHLAFSNPTHMALVSISYFPTYWGV